MSNVTFGHGTEIDSGFLQQVSYDERDWLFDSSTPTHDTGPDEDYTEGDTDGLFAYLEGDCAPGVHPLDCESERVNMQYWKLNNSIKSQYIHIKLPRSHIGQNIALEYTEMLPIIHSYMHTLR